LEILEADEGFCRILRRVELHDLSRKERRKQQRRGRKEKCRIVPSPTAVFHFLKDQVYFYPEIRIFPSKSEKENGKFATLTQA